MKKTNLPNLKKETGIPSLCWWCNKKFRGKHFFNFFYDRAWRYVHGTCADKMRDKLLGNTNEKD